MKGNNRKTLLSSHRSVCRTNFLFMALILFSFGIDAFGQGSGDRTITNMMPSSGIDLGQIENINPYNGTLNFALPLSQTSGRGSSQNATVLSIHRQFVTRYISDPYGGPWPYTQETNQWEPEAGYGPGLLRKIDEGSPDYWQDNQGHFWVRNTDERASFQWDGPDGSSVRLYDNGGHNGLYQHTQLPLPQCQYPPPEQTRGVNRGRIFSSRDGSGIVFIADEDVFDNICFASSSLFSNGFLKFSDGTTIRIDVGQVSYMQDRNGNRTSFDYYPPTRRRVHMPGGWGWPAPPSIVGDAKRIHRITDNLARQVDFTYDIPDTSPYLFYDQIDYRGFGAEIRTLKIHYSTLENALKPGNTLKTYCQLGVDCQGVTSGEYCNPFVAVAVELPDSRSYRFKYNSYGELARVELPTGGAVEYEHEFAVLPLYNLPDDSIYRRVTERRLYPNGESGAAYSLRTLFSQPAYEYSSAGCNCSVIPQQYVKEQVDVSQYEKVLGNDQLISRTRHYYDGAAVSPNRVYYASTPGYPTDGLFYYSWKNGHEYKTEVFDSDNSTLLRRFETTWQQRSNVQYLVPDNKGNFIYGPQEYAPENYPRLVETVTTLEDNLVAKRSSINPQTGAVGFDENNNPTDVYEFDYGSGQPGSFLRRTHIDYKTDPNYTGDLGPHLIRLPIQTWVSSDSGGNNKTSLTQDEYDNYASDSRHAGLIDRATVSGFDSANYGTSFTRRGNVTSTTSYSDAANQTGPVTFSAQFDILGSIVKIIDANVNSATIAYDDNFGSPDNEATTNTPPSQLNGQNTFAFPTSTTNALNWTAHVQYDYYTGQPVNTQDVNGMISKTTYNDPLDRPRQAVTAIGTSQESQTTILYDDSSHSIQKTSDLNALNDNLLKSVSYYDGWGRTIESRSYQADGNYRAAQTVYDALGRTNKVSNPFRPGDTVLWTTTSFDSLGRLIKTKTPDDAESLVAYDGNRTLVTDQAGKKLLSKTNSINQLKEAWEITGADTWTEAVSFPGQLFSSGYKTNYSYDTLSNLTSVNQGGQTRTFVYDSLSRLTSASSPETGTTSYGYDANGNLMNKSDARSISTNYVYDALNRVTQRAYSTPNPTPSPSQYQNTPTVTYYYDNVTNARGKLTKVTSSVSTTEYTAFDILGRVTGHQQTTDGQQYTTGYTYNLAGGLIEETYPSGRVVRNVLDNSGDLSLVESKKNPAGGYWHYADSISYTAAGAVSSLQLGNGHWESTVFNHRLQPTEIALGVLPGASNILRLQYDYGDWVNGVIDTSKNNGNIVQQVISVPSVGGTQNGFTAIQKYYYDSLNRIDDATEDIGMTRTWRQDFSYDRYGNRNFIEANTTTIPRNCNGQICILDHQIYNPAINTSNNLLSATESYGFDRAGNLASDPQSRSFVYDAQNKLVSGARDGAAIGQYYYDGEGRRVKKSVPGTGEVTIFIYDAAGKSVAEYSTIVADIEHAKVAYLTSDDLGSPRINTDANGIVISRHDYRPFGEGITLERANHPDYEGDLIRKQFTDYERDSEVGLDFAEARTYWGALGRFGSGDPLVFASVFEPQSWNKYNYCVSNPISLTDAAGLWPPPLHDLIFRLALPGLTKDELESLQQGGRSVDLDGLNPRTLWPWNSPEHAMTSYFYPDPQYAERAMNDFIDTNVRDAQSLGYSDEGRRAAGAACHPGQDGTSPAHCNFQYDGLPNAYWTITGAGYLLKYAFDKGDHINRESRMSYVQLDAAVASTRKVFRRAFPDQYSTAVPDHLAGATFYFDSPITGDRLPSSVDVGKIAEITVHADGRKEIDRKWFPGLIDP